LVSGLFSQLLIALQLKQQPFEYLKPADNLDTQVDGLLFDVSINVMKDYTVFTHTKRNLAQKSLLN
jgi:hypothetical protein